MLTLYAPAKINFFLYITARRADGFHILQSFFAHLKLADTITIEPATELTIHTMGAQIEHNTATKAALMLQEYTHPLQGAKITIEKKIPLGAGLGGSSTDAAAVLTGLNQFWNLKLPAQTLATIANHLGSDTAYFLAPAPAIVEGCGELIHPMTLNHIFHLLIVYPGFPMLSKNVYTQGVIRFSARINPTPHDVLQSIMQGCNDLEAPAIKLNPHIQLLLNEIQLLKGCKVARMSGSGSACFGIFQDQISALEAQERLEHKYFTYYEPVMV